MKICLINPPWSFDGSIYFGCREPHLPLELGYCKALLDASGHETLMLDGALDDIDMEGVRQRVEAFGPDMTVFTTAPTYLFWRCTQPELRVPQELVAAIGHAAGKLVAVGPHGSTTPRTTLRKLGVDLVVMGECEEVVARIAGGDDPAQIMGTAWFENGEPRVNGGPAASEFVDHPPLRWPDAWVQRHRHHHHRFDSEPTGPGAEVEASRGCPYNCTFCAKQNFRDKYRRRNLDLLLQEIDGLRDQGVEYLYFVDEIFLPDRRLLEALVGRGLKFGVQTRIDLWKPDMIDLLSEAGCVSIEAGMESLTVEGRKLLDKNCKMDTDALTERLAYAKQRVPFVQANLIALPTDDDDLVTQWRDEMRAKGVWANDPVPLFPYPGSPEYVQIWGLPDDTAWERAVDHYLGLFDHFSDIQDERPLPVPALERRAAE